MYKHFMTFLSNPLKWKSQWIIMFKCHDIVQYYKHTYLIHDLG